MKITGLWQDADTKVFAEIMRGINEGYASKPATFSDDIKTLLTKPDSHIYYWNDGKNEVCFAIVEKPNLNRYKIQMAGYRGATPADGMLILAKKLVELLKEKGKPFYAVIAEVNTKTGTDFYGAIPDACLKVGITCKKGKLTKTESIITTASYRWWDFNLPSI